MPEESADEALLGVYDHAPDYRYHGDALASDVAAWLSDFIERWDSAARGDHDSDAHCTLDATDSCETCGVFHGEPCAECDGRGFHAERCQEGSASCNIEVAS
jgi:hypothetical protein